MALPMAGVILSILQGFAVLLTLFRVSFRVWIGRFGWEDAWAAVAFACGVVSLITLYTHEVESKRVQFVSSWIYLCSWPGVLWTVRLSCLASVIRIVQPGRLHQLTLASGWLFVAFFVGLTVQRTNVCLRILEPSRKEGSEGPYICLINHSMAISMLVADVVSDAILVTLSLRVLWGVRLKRRQHRMILAIFVSSAAVTMASIFHAVSEFVSKESTTPQLTEALVEIVTSLVVCNLLVIVPLLYRIIARHKRSRSGSTSMAESSEPTSDDDDDDFTQSRPHRRTIVESSAQTSYLTTVELSIDSTLYTESEKELEESGS